MYRVSSDSLPLTGVQNGPYAGPPREFPVSRLPAATLTRLADAIAGRGVVRLICARRAPFGLRLLRQRPRRWAALLAVGWLGLLVAGMCSWLLPDVAAIGFGAGLTLIALLWDWDSASASPPRVLREGVYLFPLDLVEVLGSARSPETGARHRSGSARSPETGARHRRGSVVRVTPLGFIGSARLGGSPFGHRGSGGTRAAATLVLSFRDGAEHVFPLDGSAAQDIEATLARSQELLERLTYGSALAEAFQTDLFFDVRGESTWTAPAPPAGGFTPKRVLARALVAFACGGCAVFARNFVADETMWTMALGSEAYDAYLAKTRYEGRHAGMAWWLWIDRIAGRLPAPSAAPVPPSLDEGADAENMPSGGTEAFGARASGEDAVARFNALLSRGNARLPIVFSRERRGRIPEAAADAVGDEGLRAREDRVVTALRIAISEAIPASVMRVERSTDPRAEDLRASSLDVHYEVRFDERPPAPGLAIVYDVRWRVGGFPDRAFRLTMPPPSTPLVQVRVRSLFPALRPEPLLSRGGIDTRPYDATTARDFDRLYDELFALFFKGDPVVPLSLTEQLAPFGAPSR
jgi:hypothetical protein